MKGQPVGGVAPEASPVAIAILWLLNRNIIIAKKLQPMGFWWECARNAAHKSNRLPTKAIGKSAAGIRKSNKNLLEAMVPI